MGGCVKGLFPSSAIGSAVLLLASASLARPHRHGPPAVAAAAARWQQRPPLPESVSRSVGRPSRGRLLNGVQMSEAPFLNFKRGSLEHERWGTEELVTMVQSAAQHVASILPGAKMTMGDLSRRRGGRMRPHRSHRNGRDVDIGFYAMDASGKSAEPDQFIRFRANGWGWAAGKRYRFDDARNWEMIAALLTSKSADIQYIFISRGLRWRLLREAARRDASPALIDKASKLLYQPRRGGRHNDHIHVRIFCPPDDRPLCRDKGPFWPWHPDPNEQQVSSAPFNAPLSIAKR